MGLVLGPKGGKIPLHEPQKLDGVSFCTLKREIHKCSLVSQEMGSPSFVHVFQLVFFFLISDDLAELHARCVRLVVRRIACVQKNYFKN